MGLFSRIEKIVGTVDRAMQRIERTAINLINGAIDTAYRSFEDRFSRSYQHHSSNKDLLPNERRALIIEDVKHLLRIINPGNTPGVDRTLLELLYQSHDYGVNLGEQLTELTLDKELQLFSGGRSAITSQVIEARQRLLVHSEYFANSISPITEIGLQQSAGVRRVLRNVRNQIGITKGRTEMIARTEAFKSLNEAALAVYKANNIQHVVWYASGDDRTCPVCAARSGNIYRIGFVSLPAHPACRCVLIPVNVADDKSWLAELHQQGLADLKSEGRTPQYDRLSPFEKMAGLDRPPEPAWKASQSDSQ